MTAKQRAALKRAIKQLVAASIAESWIGVEHIAEHERIRRELALAKRRVNDAINNIAAD